MGALEALAGELAASRIGEAELAEIEALHHQMRAHYLRAELPEYFRLNQSIHERIVAAAGNPVLQATYHGLGMRLKRARYAANLWSKARWDRAMAEHDGLLDALRRRAGAELAAKLKAHLAGKCEAVCAQMTGADAA
jgi:DNA-binding GntR family transcriptional regulator